MIHLTSEMLFIYLTEQSFVVMYNFNVQIEQNNTKQINLKVYGMLFEILVEQVWWNMAKCF